MVKTRDTWKMPTMQEVLFSPYKVRMNKRLIAAATQGVQIRPGWIKGNVGIRSKPRRK